MKVFTEEDYGKHALIALIHSVGEVVFLGGTAAVIAYFVRCLSKTFDH